MKKTIAILLMLVLTLGLNAQNRRHPHFDPEKFEADMEQFITQRAALTPMEASRFFPLFREMQRKQRDCFHEMRIYRHLDTSDDNMCAEAIKKMDKIDIQIKKIQQEYHLKFMKVLPAGKVMEIIRAEDKFHRQAFKKAAEGPGPL